MTKDSKHADVVILGLGAWGSAIAYHAARRGLKVLGFDQFEVPHEHGSSHGKTRAFHESAAEGDAYLPLNLRAAELYDDLGDEYGTPLLVRTGVAYVGPSESYYVEGVRSMQEHGLPYELYDPVEAAKRFPHYPLREGEAMFYEPGAGTIFPEKTILAHLAGARSAGAELRMSERIDDWKDVGDHLEITTPQGAYHTDRLVIAAGPWAPQWVGDQVPISVERQVVAWLSPEGTPFADSADWPVFSFPWIKGYKIVYGFPDIEGDGVKVALHHGGDTGVLDELDHAVTDEDLEQLREAVAARIPSLANAPFIKSATCWYTNAPDLLHLIGEHRDNEKVLVATGDSGRGFKLAPVVGELVADLLQGETSEHHETLDISRKIGTMPWDTV